MDLLNELKGSDSNSNWQQSSQTHEGQSSSGGGFMDKINSAMSSGKESEKHEGVDWVQERMDKRPQDNESAVEQAKDEQISDAIRRGFKGVTGTDNPSKDIIKDWDKAFKESKEIIILAGPSAEIGHELKKYRRYNGLEDLLDGKETKS